MHSIADYFLEVLMGRFLNPDNGAFSEAVNSEIYIDIRGKLLKAKVVKLPFL